jgi:hypothetical protein
MTGLELLCGKLFIFGLIVIIAGMPDHDTQNPGAAVAGRQAIVMILTIALMFLAGCGESPCAKACDGDYGFARGEGDGKVCFCQRTNGQVYGPVPYPQGENADDADPSL